LPINEPGKGHREFRLWPIFECNDDALMRTISSTALGRALPALAMDSFWSRLALEP
jgi:hypothetical protein